MFSHMIQMKPTTNALIRWTPMSPGITQLYKASKIGNWCLHNVPMIVIPHPDFALNNGEAILAQLRHEFNSISYYKMQFQRICLLDQQ